MVEMIWEEPAPRRVRTKKTPIVEELQKHPGRWALVVSQAKSSSAAVSWRTLGCEATPRPSKSGNKGEYDVYARWPEKAAKPVPVPNAKETVTKAVTSGTALKPPATAAPRPSLPAPKASGGYSQFLANQRAGTVAAAAE